MKRIGALLTAIVLLVCPMARAETALSVNGAEVSRGEADAWMFLVRDSYAEINDWYERCLGVSYWSLSYPNGMSVWMSVKSDAFKQLVMLCLLAARAPELGVTLTQAERSAAGKRAEEYISAAGSVGFTAEDMRALLEREALAQKVYALLVSYQDIDEESVRAAVDADACAALKAEYLCAPREVYSGSAQAREKTESELRRMAGFRGAYSEAVRLNPDFSSGFTVLSFRRLRKDPALSALAELDEGMVSGIIETDLGLFIFRVAETGSEELYEAAVEDALWKARTQAFEAEFERMYEQCDYELSSEYWDSLRP